MRKRKNSIMILGFVLSVSLIAVTLTAILITNFYQRMQFQMLGTIFQNIIEEQPEVEKTILTALKEYKNNPTIQADENILHTFGYQQSDFLQFKQKYSMIFAIISFLFGGFLFFFTFCYQNRKENLRIAALENYLEKVNTGNHVMLFQTDEDNFSKLQDEIYKTVTMLYQTRDAAIETKNNFAENLSNIAHQLKTPITSISLLTQMMKEGLSKKYAVQIQKQLSRLTHLEEALLLLSRIDAGTLSLEKKVVDVFTVLVLAADNLQEVFLTSNVSVEIPELGEVEIMVDFDWTMEAIMNLLKNCMELTPAEGVVHCSYAQNSLYTEIQIWDEGKGFVKEDIPHLFERFYRGKNAKDGGIGIGLSIAKEIIERQNGTIRAKNIPNGGACFEVRFYSH